MQKTLALIKPDAVAINATGEIIKRIQTKGFRIKAMKMTRLSLEIAEDFYDVHKGKPFYDDLNSFMISGPIVAMVLEKENAIKAWRDLMGATNFKEAAEGTIRKDFGSAMEKNAVHGSDAPETAAREISFFFSKMELVG
ncbi:nucleoside-diphosphate kinase [Desulforegula conservatrix]|uniref:nucleoside-diphosphate kinase n=1 Tax=Desulforegula conservatrix TaxID=153026 RepID=UPI000417429E|nr:nucleoside-diphosphate kinase [Desulforegula conservatrix]